MIYVEREEEREPSSWPGRPDDLTEGAEAIPKGVVWSRLEQYITRRWDPRKVIWRVSGWGAFVPRLWPADLDQVKEWDGTGWHDVTDDLTKTPDGVILTGGTYEIEYTVGDSSEDVPDRMKEAYRRLSEYWAEVEQTDTGFTSITDGDYSMRRAANAAGRALYYSGAADLIRVYR